MAIPVKYVYAYAHVSVQEDTHKPSLAAGVSGPCVKWRMCVRTLQDCTPVILNHLTI